MNSFYKNKSTAKISLRINADTDDIPEFIKLLIIIIKYKIINLSNFFKFRLLKSDTKPTEKLKNTITFVRESEFVIAVFHDENDRESSGILLIT